MNSLTTTIKHRQDLFIRNEEIACWDLFGLVLKHVTALLLKALVYWCHNSYVITSVLHVFLPAERLTTIEVSACFARFWALPAHTGLSSFLGKGFKSSSFSPFWNTTFVRGTFLCPVVDFILLVDYLLNFLMLCLASTEAHLTGAQVASCDVNLHEDACLYYDLD